MQEEKLIQFGLAYSDNLNYEQTLCLHKERKSYMNRADELRGKIRRVHCSELNTAEDLYSKCWNQVHRKNQENRN